VGYSDIIAREAETLAPEKQVEILDFIAFLKVGICPLRYVSTKNCRGNRNVLPKLQGRRQRI
jgi:hypothetical protein